MDYGTPFDRHTIIEDSHETKKKKKWVPKLEEPASVGLGGLLRRLSKRDRDRTDIQKNPMVSWSVWQEKIFLLSIELKDFLEPMTLKNFRVIAMLGYTDWSNIVKLVLNLSSCTTLKFVYTMAPCLRSNGKIS